ncbi:hypothetical protein ACIQTT_13420 [Microbacterium sp. NPDC090225]|uniref:hypothetical protein n=1 Tax=Microbacterium sp. NPDC090225 TaxID=3364207 RepID=UPI0037FE3C32
MLHDEKTGLSLMVRRCATIALVCAAVPLTACSFGGSPAPSPTATAEAIGPDSAPIVRISFEWEGEKREVVGEATQPMCDPDGSIIVIGGDSRTSTGVTLRLDDEDPAESSVAAWVGGDEFAANFQGEGEVTVTPDGSDAILSVTDLSGTATVAAREAGSEQTFNEAIDGGQRVDATASFVVLCPDY